ncbi:hypothetical protein C8F04DRAFT_1184590 [Mycena alexandri]|uniref:Uncharacterized protein n=1 Tax=Mycena alexandri TaxID=1745969 RepID=A0AAD6ST03_9AGAR|nr:hypothetical protein C8F04DRAFT_1184590 [Mycena alexandri]
MFDCTSISTFLPGRKASVKVGLKFGGGTQSLSVGPVLGPPSTQCTITRSITLPEGALGNPARLELQNDVVDDATASASPSPRVSTFTHFGLIPYTDPKAETALLMAKRTTGNLETLAKIVHKNESRMQTLEGGLGKITVELCLSNFPNTQMRSGRSPSIPRGRSRSHSASRDGSRHRRGRSQTPRGTGDGPLDELYDRVEVLEAREQASREDMDDLADRISRLENRLSSPTPDDLSAAELGALVSERFTEVTSDRDFLLQEIKQLGEKQEKAEAESKILQKDLAALRSAFTRLELATLAPPRPAMDKAPPLETPIPIPIPTASIHCRAPAPALPGVTPPLLPIKGPPPTLVLIVLVPRPVESFKSARSSSLGPLTLFQSVIVGALPTFKFTGSYTVERDLQYQSHLRVMLQHAKDAKNLLVDWDMGERLAGMREVDTDGYLVGGKHFVHAFCKGTAVQQLTATGGFRGVYTWEGGTPLAQQLTRADGQVPPGFNQNPAIQMAD